MNESVKNIQPLGFQWHARDPFLFCVHHDDFYPKGNSKFGPDPALLKGRQLGQDFQVKDGWRMYHGETIPGFPYHPHRGFETVTVVRKGWVDHTDSMGAAGRYGNGDIQWLTAGKGIQHAEMFPLLNQDTDNNMELFQIWLNLPKKNKFTEPHFKMLWAETIPHYEHTDSKNKKTTVEIIAGAISNLSAPEPPPNSWAALPENEVAIWNIQMEAGATWMLPKASQGINRSLYFYRGNTLNIDGLELKKYHAADLNAAMEIMLVNGTEPAGILILQGKPIGEPVVQHGPFVMNSNQEIQQAFDDYQKTQFGGWPWPVSNPVHDRNKGRFALHGNGILETKY